MRINLRVWDSSDNQFYLELYSNDPINLTKQFQDILSVNAPSGSFTQTFRIPATENNQAVFDNFEDVNSQGDFNPKRKLKAELEANTLTVLSGYVQFVACYIEKKGFPEYEIVFFGETVNLFRSVGDKKLNELDLSSYDHEVNYTNVVSSWAGTLFSGDVIYGIVDKGRNWAQDGTGNPITSTSPIYPAQLTPFLREKVILEKIINEAGFTIESTFLDSSYFTNQYTPLLNGGSLVERDLSESNLFAAGLTADETVTGSNGVFISNAFSDSAPFYDPDGYFNTATDSFSPPATGEYMMELNATVDATSSPLNLNKSISVAIRNITDSLNVYQTDVVSIPAGAEYIFSEAVTVELDSTKDYSLAVIYSQQDGYFTVKGNNQLSNVGGNTWIRHAQSYNLLYGFDTSLSLNAPDIKQKDYLSSIQKMFNLVFVPDENDSTKILIEPFQDYKGTGNTLDWTNLIDYDKSVKIEPTTSIQKRDYEWTYSEDKDIANKFYKDNADRIYGRYLIEDTENDFSTGKETIKNPFGAYPCSYINGTTIVIHKTIDASGQVIKDPKCKSVFWGGLIDSETIFIYDDSTSSSQAVTQYPYFGHYSNPVATIDGEDLNYGGETPLHNIEGNPYNNLYNKYWRDYVNELYSVESRKMTAFFNLDLVTYYSLGFDDLIFIKDAYWRVLKVNQFQPNLDELTQVELIKILDTPRPCEYIPSTISTGGVVQFLDSAGATSGGSEECCTFWGYEWSNVNSRCYAFGSQEIVLPPTGLSTRGVSNERAISMGTNSIGVGSSNGVYSGSNNNIGRGNAASIVVGENNTVLDDIGFSQVFGKDAYAWSDGLVISRNAIAKIGDAQSGVKILTFNGAMSGTVTLFPYLDIPNNSTLAIDMNYCLSEWNAASSRIVSEHNLSVSTVITKDGSGSSFVTPVIIKDVGTSGSGHYTPDIDNTTDATQHRIQLTKSGSALSNNVNIVCRIEYTMTRH
tara:strand:+ start:2353 stop:5268 length:2916 start_codon:yes stop_codon:yes gene_type:complete